MICHRSLFVNSKAQAWLLTCLLHCIIVVDAWTAGRRASGVRIRNRIHQQFACPNDDGIASGEPLIVWELNCPEDDDTANDLTWSRITENRDGHDESLQAATLTWNWCHHWVRALELCPWAKTSLETSGAIQFFVLPQSATLTQQSSRDIVEEVARRFIDEIIQNDNGDGDDNEQLSIIVRTAIFFILFLPDQDASSFANNFLHFFEWFTEMEEEWDEGLDDVIIAPFHPNWEFGGMDEQSDEEEQRIEQALCYEKKAPFPLVSLVSTRVVEQAGEAVTSKIGAHNQEVLTKLAADLKEIDKMEKMWQNTVNGDKKGQK